MNSELRDRLELLQGMPGGLEKSNGFKIFEPLFSTDFDKEACMRILKSILKSDDYSCCKTVLPRLFRKLQEVDEKENSNLMELSEMCEREMVEKRQYYGEAYVVSVDLISQLYQADGDYFQAASILKRVDTEEQHFQSAMTVDRRCEWRIRTAELFLENGDTTSATSHIQKARRIIREVPLQHEKRPELHIRYKTCYARILDSERKFLQAAVNYMELSQIDSPLVGESDLLESLNHSMTCAILGKAGPARSRVLAMLFRDARARTLRNYRVMEKMHLTRIISDKEQDAFRESLDEHHKVDLGHGLTVLKKAMYEHNMLAASQLYKNIRMEELDKLLGTGGADLAEDLARQMIEEGRMKATIDQIDSTIEFATSESRLLEWDARIQNLCMAMNDVCDAIDTAHPNKYELP